MWTALVTEQVHNEDQILQCIVSGVQILLKADTPSNTLKQLFKAMRKSMFEALCNVIRIPAHEHVLYFQLISDWIISHATFPCRHMRSISQKDARREKITCTY